MNKVTSHECCHAILYHFFRLSKFTSFSWVVSINAVDNLLNRIRMSVVMFFRQKHTCLYNSRSGESVASIAIIWIIKLINRGWHNRRTKLVSMRSPITKLIVATFDSQQVTISRIIDFLLLRRFYFSVTFKPLIFNCRHQIRKLT